MPYLYYEFEHREKVAEKCEHPLASRKGNTVNRKTMVEENNSLRTTAGSKDAEMQALLNLIDEPQEANYERIRSHILSYGPAILAPLEGLLDCYFDETIQARIMGLIEDIQFQDVSNSLEKWAKEESHNLIKGFFIISRFQYPNLVFGDVFAQIDTITRDVWLEMNDDLTALEKVKVINHILFDVHKFAPNKTDFHTPQNFFLNTVLAQKKGSPLALGMLYMFVSRSLGIPVFGVNLPQHFVLAYTREGFLESDQLPGVEDVLFYINPFSQGSVFTQHEIALFLKHLKLENDTSYYTPCNNATILRRLITNLIISYEKGKETDKSEALRNLLTVLPPAGSVDDSPKG